MNGKPHYDPRTYTCTTWSSEEEEEEEVREWIIEAVDEKNYQANHSQMVTGQLSL